MRNCVTRKKWHYVIHNDVPVVLDTAGHIYNGPRDSAGGPLFTTTKRKTVLPIPQFRFADIPVASIVWISVALYLFWRCLV